MNSANNETLHALELVAAAGRAYVYGFSWRKRLILGRMLGNIKICSIHIGTQVPHGSIVILWGSRPSPHWLGSRVRIIRVEDGFLRSVGLGADLVRPLSWVFDANGMYFDSTHQSDLEYILQAAQFDDQMLRRATLFRENIVSSGLSKYNIGSGTWKRPAFNATADGAGEMADQGAVNANRKTRVILVPGQVESDASLQFGAPGIRSNIGLLHAVRSAHPQAFVVYKPHPDVVAGLRAKGADEENCTRFCDEVVTDVAMAELLTQVDEVHTMTSLTGFEALLRGKAVTCYGQPFYAGWGLTSDIVPVARRQRQLSIDQLVAGALLIYPAYMNRLTGRATTAEHALSELLSWRERSAGNLPWWRKSWRIMTRVALRLRFKT